MGTYLNLKKLPVVLALAALLVVILACAEDDSRSSERDAGTEPTQPSASDSQVNQDPTPTIITPTAVNQVSISTQVPPTATTTPPIPEPTSTPKPAAKLDRPSIDLPGGLYVGPQMVEITTNEPNSQIWYTLDGSDPSETNGIAYNGPIELFTQDVTTVTAVVTSVGALASDSTSSQFRFVENEIESKEPIVLSGNDVLEISDTYYKHRGAVTLSGDSKLIITNSVFEHVKDFAFEHELKVTDNAEVIVTNSGISTTCNGSFNWAFFDNSKLTVNGMNPALTKCNTWNFMSGTSSINVTDWETFSGTVCDQTSVSIQDSHRMEVELCMPWPTIMDTELPTVIDQYVFDPGENSTIEFALTMQDSTVDGWGINVGPESDITIRNTPGLAVGVGIGYPSVSETMVAEGIRPGHWDDQQWEFGAGAKLRLVNSYTYGWELNAWGGNTMAIRNSDYAGSAVNGSDSKYIIENSTSGQLVAFEEVEMLVTNSIITGDVVANDNTVITLIDSVVGEEGNENHGGNVFARGNGKVILKNTKVLGDQTTQDNGEIIVE